MDLLKATPELLSEYLNFLLRFATSPAQAMESYVPTAEGEPKISPRLLLFAAFAVGAGFVLSQIGAALGMAADGSTYVHVIGRIDRKALPFALLVAIVIGTVIVHGVAWLWTLVAGWVFGARPFKGAVANSINAALAFTAWMLPLAVLAIVVLRVLGANDVPAGVAMAIVLPFGLLFWVYLAAALAAAHRIPFQQVWLTILGTGMLWIIIKRIVG